LLAQEVDLHVSRLQLPTRRRLFRQRETLGQGRARLHGVEGITRNGLEQKLVLHGQNASIARFPRVQASYGESVWSSTGGPLEASRGGALAGGPPVDLPGGRGGAAGRPRRRGGAGDRRTRLVVGASFLFGRVEDRPARIDRGRCAR